MSSHPISREVLGRFGDCTATGNERLAVVRHLLAGCEYCRFQLRNYWPDFTEARNIEISDEIYASALENSTDRALASFALIASDPKQLLSELEGKTPKDQLQLVRSQQRYWSTEFCEVLIERSHEARFSSTAVMCHRAHLAVLVTENLPREFFSREITEDWRGRAWAALGNALRVSGDLNAADKALLKAQSHLFAGSGVDTLRAQMLSQLASLRFDQRRFADSLSLISQVVQIWRNLDDKKELARALVLQSMATGESGRPRAAVQLLMEAGRLVECGSEPKLALIILHSIIRFYTDGGHSEVALRLYFEARQLYEQESDPLIRIKVLWLEGQIMSAERHLELALQQLSAARAGFIAQDNRYEAALVSLDLAAVLAKLGRFTEMRMLARETLQEMEERGVRREAIAALILLQQTATSDAALSVIRRVASALRRPGHRRASEASPSFEQPFL